MDALLMCGGRGTRLDADVEKPLFEVGGDPMVDRVRRALADSRIETAHAVVSPHAPNTRDHVAEHLPTIQTPGDGYVDDLLVALESVETPVLTVAADLPLLDAAVVNRVLAAANGSTSVLAPTTLKELLGTSVDSDDAWVPTGVNVVGDDEDTEFRTYDARLAVNVNRRSDAAVAERLLAARTDTHTGLGDVEGVDGP